MVMKEFLIEVINIKFIKYGFPKLEICRNIVPTDNTTLFVCSGMQELKPKFANPDGRTHSSIQSCIRTNDLDSIGDGTHLSSFEMIGNFSFAATLTTLTKKNTVSCGSLWV